MAQRLRLSHPLATSALFLLSGAVHGAATPTNQLFVQAAAGGGLAVGDFISSRSGLNTYHSYFIEVPPGTSALNVEIFDADISGARDLQVGATVNTTVRYTLLSPAGAIAGTLSSGPGQDNAWVLVAQSIVAPAAGHWELRVDSSDTATSPALNGDDVNGYGLRATDGNLDGGEAGGTELNVYADSYLPAGFLGGAPAGVVLTSLFPYVTSGAGLLAHDFDSDLGQPSGGLPPATFTYTSPSGAFSQSFAPPSISGNAIWRTNAVADWTGVNDAVDYGIWASRLEINSVGSGNLLNLYLVRSGGAPPPPTGHPQPDAFPIYLQSDDGSPPLKPYLEQQVRAIGGPVTPAVGVANTLRITVRLVNPTPQALTFSQASHDVAAFVPSSSGQVSYVGGSAVPGQGTVTQPCAAGFCNGLLAWRPGAVAANDTSLLVYDVRVTPADVAEIEITGNLATNGTRARFIDETGNATQARATRTLGPISPLRVQVGVTTHAVVTDFRLLQSAGGVVVEWQTRSEAGTLGFHLYRWQEGKWRAVVSELVPALDGAASGGTYRVLDRRAPHAGQLHYLLEEIEPAGQSRWLGPFTGTASTDNDDRETEARSAADSLESAASTLELEEVGFTRRARPLEASWAFDGRQVEPADSNWLPGETVDALAPRLGVREPAAVRVGIEEAGLYVLPADQLATAMGARLGEVREWLSRGALELLQGGEPVAWHALGAGDGMVFVGEALQSPFTRENAYWIRRGRGWPIVAGGGTSASAVDPSATFVRRRHYEENTFAGTAGAQDPDSDFWYWETLSAGSEVHGHRNFALRIEGPAVDAGGRTPAVLEVHVRSVTTLAIAGEHSLVARVNGTTVGEATWSGVRDQTLRATLDPLLLREGDNAVELEAVRPAGVAYSILYVDGFDLHYPSRYQASAGELRFSGNGRDTVMVSGFSSSAVRLYDVTSPRLPRALAVQPVPVPGGYGFPFRPVARREYLAVETTALRAPASLTARPPSDYLKRALDGAELLLVTTSDLLSAAARYADQRRGQGVSVEVVDAAAIYDAFAGGVRTPYAIRDLVAHAYRTWRIRPRYLLLLGDGNYDYHDHLGLGGNRLPPLLAATDQGLYASDVRFGDVVGSDNLPEVVVGRLPVHSAAAVDGLVDKLAAYADAAGETWLGNVLLLADDPGESDFGADSDRAAGGIPSGYTPLRLYLQTPAQAPALRSALLGALAGGAVALNYQGHAGLDRLASEGLLTTADVGALGNAGRLPIVAALTCAANRFEVPGLDPLGGVLATGPERGAIAVWSATGLSHHQSARALDRLFLDELLRRSSTLGQAVDRSLRRARDAGLLTPDVLKVYNLLGDPSLALPDPPDFANPAIAGDGT